MDCVIALMVFLVANHTCVFYLLQVHLRYFSLSLRRLLDWYMDVAFIRM